METEITKDVEKFQRRSPHESNLPDLPQDSPSAVVMAAIQRGYDPAFIEKMMDLQLRHEQREAEKEFNQAIADFKANPLNVIKDKKNRQTNSMYATVGNFLATVNPELSKHGLSARFEIDDQTNKELMTVACILSHRSGHSIQSKMSAPPDTKGPKGEPNKTEIHGRMSTLTYLMRATFSAVTGIAAIDDKFDDDGNVAGQGESINEKQLSQIVDMLNDVNADDKDTNTFLKVLSGKGRTEIKTLKSIPASLFDLAVKLLKNKKEQMEKGGKDA